MYYLKTFILLFLLSPILYAEAISQDTISAQIQNTLQRHLKGQNRPIVEQMYRSINYHPIWIGNGNSGKLRQLMSDLKDPLFNYKNKSFDQESIKQLFFQLDTGEIPEYKRASVYARIDVMLSNSYVRLVRFIVQGDVDWNLVQKKLRALAKSDDIKSHWEMSFKPFPNISTLTSAALHGNTHAYLTSLIPMQSHYFKLIKILKKYQNMHNVPQIPYSNKVLKLGNSDNRVKIIKKRLQLSGDYPKNAPINSKFDARLKNAVITYQRRYLLKVDGMVDKTTTYYMNQPISKNIQAIMTNLDKTKLYPKHFENEYVEVNIPDFTLRYYKNGRRISKMDLIVGRIDRPTPLFNNYIRYMVLNPTWTIPNNLIKRDLIHVVRENPMYLKENNIHAFSGNKEISVTSSMLDPYENNSRRVPYRFVQFPGENNALGRVKFMFPNKYAVYLHDTDNKTLFDRRYKIYSSGCMRVKKPYELMKILLNHTRGYSQGRLDAIFATNKPTTIKLNKPIPVHIVYFTVYEEDGLAYFKHDIYLYDMIIQQSTFGYRKSSFSIPKKRMIQIKKKEQKPLSN